MLDCLGHARVNVYFRFLFTYNGYMTTPSIATQRPLSPWLEMGAYEFLWTKAGQSFRTLAELFRDGQAAPSDLVIPTVAEKFAKDAIEILRNAKVESFGIRLQGTGDYPDRLLDAKYPVQLLYFQGWWDLVETPSVAVVGTRNPSLDGLNITAALVRKLVEDGFTIVSGLASGIDTVAHRTAIEMRGMTIAVLGTPLSKSYPSENADLQQEIARDHLLISQVPIVRYVNQDWRQNRAFFPQRNVTMSALTKATIIVEASDTSGTLMQAKAAIQQGRKLFIMDECFADSSLKWPREYEKLGAIRVKDYENIKNHLPNAPLKN